MSIGVVEQERRRITEIADEYRRRGYAVTIEPSLDEVPAFIAPYRPDLIAKGPNEIVVIEVKAGSRTPVDLVRVAQAINGRPGWRFEVVVLDIAAQDHPSSLQSTEQLELMLSEVQRLIEHEMQTAAFILLWAATEGALRHAAVRSDMEPDGDPRRLARQLTSHGLITQTDLRLLETCLSARNQAVHGFVASALDAPLIQQLLLFARRLLQAGETVSDTFDFATVSEWTRLTLERFDGFRLEDAVFDRDAVVIRAPDGAECVITMEQWTDIEPSERLNELREAVQQWARTHLPPRKNTR